MIRLVILVGALIAAGWLGWHSDPFLGGFGVIMALLTGLWVISLLIKDASIIDSFWGPGFLVMAGYAMWVAADEPTTRDWLLLGMVAVWSLRLGLHIFIRNHGHGEDYRYQQWRKEAGAQWWWRSYLKVFFLQGLLLWVISAPLMASRFGQVDGITILDWIGVAIWGIGFTFESVGDWQLRRFKADPANQGKVMDQGLWGLTRHPNYFGDALLWWGYFCFALSAGGWMYIFSPLLMSGLLMKVSGVTLLEQDLKKKPGYAEYVANTPAFFPRLIPRRP